MLFSKSAKVEGEPKGVSIKEAELYVKEFLKRFQGADNVSVRVRARTEDTFGSDRSGELGRIKGGFSPNERGGDLVLIASNLSDIRDLKQALQHEFFVHKGLGLFSPEDRQELISAVLNGASSNPSLKSTWNVVNHTYRSESDQLEAEDVIARLSKAT